MDEQALYREMIETALPEGTKWGVTCHLISGIFEFDIWLNDFAVAYVDFHPDRVRVWCDPEELVYPELNISDPEFHSKLKEALKKYLTQDG